MLCSLTIDVASVFRDTNSVHFSFTRCVSGTQGLLLTGREAICKHILLNIRQSFSLVAFEIKKIFLYMHCWKLVKSGSLSNLDLVRARIRNTGATGH